MDYVILDEYEIKSLQNKVNTYIKKGYRLIGGVSAVNQKDGFIEYLQPMVKDTDEDQ